MPSTRCCAAAHRPPTCRAVWLGGLQPARVPTTPSVALQAARMRRCTTRAAAHTPAHGSIATGCRPTSCVLSAAPASVGSCARRAALRLGAVRTALRPECWASRPQATRPRGHEAMRPHGWRLIRPAARHSRMVEHVSCPAWTADDVAVQHRLPSLCACLRLPAPSCSPGPSVLVKYGKSLTHRTQQTPPS
jgi:hypothetical protein